VWYNNVVSISGADLADVVRAISDANDELLAAAADGDGERMADLMDRAASLEKQRNRLLRTAGASRPVAYASAVPLRDQVIRGLRLGGRPLSARLLADLARARYGDAIATPKLSSLRRDEAASWTAAYTGTGRTPVRDVYVVPALTFDRFAPVRGTLALSSWPLADRIIAPASPRVDMLHVTLAIAAECDAAPPGAPWLPGLSRLLWRLARTVPGLGRAGEDDLRAVRDAVGAELDVLADEDRREREISVSRARAALDEYTLLFGTATGVHRGAAVREA
jgi:hypothetical protein